MILAQPFWVALLEPEMRLQVRRAPPTPAILKREPGVLSVAAKANRAAGRPVFPLHYEVAKAALAVA
jgi:hypothetical protein